MDRLPRQAEVATDRCVRRAVGKGVGDLASLEGIELAAQLADLAQRGSRRRGTYRLRRQLGETLTGNHRRQRGLCV
jgi:hypothetical protein